MKRDDRIEVRPSDTGEDDHRLTFQRGREGGFMVTGPSDVMLKLAHWMRTGDLPDDIGELQRAVDQKLVELARDLP